MHHPARIDLRLAAGALTLALLGVGSGATAAQQSLRDQVDVTGLKFVGAHLSGSAPDQQMTLDDIALLVASHEPITLNELIAGGLPVRSSRLQLLMSWRLMQQVEGRFQSTLPVLTDERAAAFRNEIDRVSPGIVTNAVVAIRGVAEALGAPAQVPALPALTAWILRERAWAQMASEPGIDLRSFVENQRSFLPDRGFWGVLWYTESPPEFPYEFYEDRLSEYAMQVAWHTDAGRDPFETQGAGLRREFLDKLERDGRRLDDRQRFPSLIALGLVDRENGDLRSRAARYRLDDREGLARAVEQAAADIATAILARLPATSLASALGGIPSEAALTIAYMELVPRIYAGLVEAGLPVQVGPVVLPAAPEDATELASVPSDRVRVSMGENAEEGSLPPDAAAGPRTAFSLMIWKDLPIRSLLEMPW